MWGIMKALVSNSEFLKNLIPKWNLTKKAKVTYHCRDWRFSNSVFEDISNLRYNLWAFVLIVVGRCFLVLFNWMKCFDLTNSPRYDVNECIRRENLNCWPKQCDYCILKSVVGRWRVISIWELDFFATYIFKFKLTTIFVLDGFFLHFGWKTIFPWLSSTWFS